jgi:FkbM family methyltransferase
MHPLLSGFLAHPVARKKPISTAWRMVHWQLVASKTTPREVRFGNRSRLLVTKGMSGATGNVYYGLHEFDEMMFFLKVLEPSDLFLDIGANIGSYTVLVGNEIGCRVLSFEPNPATFAHLKKNVELNGLSDLCVLNCAGVGTERGVLGFSDGLDTINHVQLVGGQIQVPVVALDEMELQSDSIFMKIDVEGFEAYVLSGGAELFRSGRVKCFMMELNGASVKYGIDEDALFAQILKYGFTAHWYDAKSKQLIALKRPTATNTWFIHSSSLQVVLNRLNRASVIEIRGIAW